MTLVIGIDEQRELLKMADTMQALETLYYEESQGRALNRRRSDTIVPNNVGVYALKSMDGVVPAFDVGAVRINSDVVTWPIVAGTKRRVKVPAASGERWVGLVLLFSISTGEPLAIFPDGYVQRMRVGGTSGLGVKYLARQNSEVLGILGSGWQAGAQILAAKEVRQIKKVIVYSPNREHLLRFVKEAEVEAGLEIQPADSADQVPAQADIVLCATNSIQPVFYGSQARPGHHIGSIRHSELDEATFRKVDRTVIHSPNASPMHLLMEGADDAEAAVEKGWSDGHGGIDWDNVPTLADLVSGKTPGRQSSQEITCFANNIGLGIQFAAVGAKMVELARSAGVGHELPTEWFTQNVHP